MVRDINAGRFANKTNLVLVTHGLALRVFLMRWFHWTLEEYLMVHNPPNAEVRVKGVEGHGAQPNAEVRKGKRYGQVEEKAERHGSVRIALKILDFPDLTSKLLL